LLKSEPSYYQIVYKEIQSVEQLMIDSIELDRQDINLLLKKLFTSGGKRIRPNIALLLGKMFNNDLEKIITLSAAIEMLHTATLVHDDLIDNALFRRGNSTLNSIWTPAATVLAGDYLFAEAAEHAANTDSLDVMKLFAQTLSTIVRGEITQFIDRDFSLDLSKYYDRIYSKTASLFKTTSTSVGLLCNVDPPQFEALSQFGYVIGMAFQIIDDILDFTGDQRTMGKPIGNDLRNNIITLPSLLFFQEQQQDYDLFVKYARNKSDSPYDLIIQHILSGSAIEESLAYARSFVQQGLSILELFPDNKFKHELIVLTLDSLTRIR
jgi:geranylgeranyl pyrophosphate synthase